MSLARLNPEILDQGRLSEHPMVELLGILFASRRSGKLHLNHGKTETRIYAKNGLPLNASTNSPGYTLLDLMVQGGRLSVQDAGRVKKLAADKGKEVAECLRELFEIEESQASNYQAQAAKEIIIKACGFKEGEYRFKDSSEVLKGFSRHDFNPLDIIYEGMTRYHITDPAGEIYALEKSKIRLNPETRDRFQLPEPLRRHRRLLDHFSAEVPMSRAIALLQGELNDINQAIHFLYLLLVTGLIVITAGPPKEAAEKDFDIRESPPPARTNKIREEIQIQGAGTGPGSSAEASTSYLLAKPRKGKAKSRDREEPAGERKTPTSGPVEKPAKAKEPLPKEAEKSKPPPAPAVSEPRTSEVKLKELRSRIKEMEKEFSQAQSPYDVLDVMIESKVGEIQEAYLKRSRQLGKESLPPDLPEDLKALARELGEKLEQAYSMLAEPDRRILYERSIWESEKKRAWDMPLKRALAQKMSKRGEWYMLHNKPEYARELFEQAIELNAQNAPYYMQLGWAIFREKPANADRAKNYLHSALKADPRLGKAYYFLGLIAKQVGEAEQAQENFRKALKLDPADPAAGRELAQLEEDLKKKGLWEKLFRR